MRKSKAAGYCIEIVFLPRSSVRLAMRRIATFVRQGGHAVPPQDVKRRFHSGSQNFEAVR
jgi:predicted ABC-type ATPase